MDRRNERRQACRQSRMCISAYTAQQYGTGTFLHESRNPLICFERIPDCLVSRLLLWFVMACLRNDHAFGDIRLFSLGGLLRLFHGGFLFAGAFRQKRGQALLDHLFGDAAGGDVLAGRDVEHDVEHHIF